MSRSLGECREVRAAVRSPHERSRSKAITTAVDWYAQHLAATNIPIVFLSSEKQSFASVCFAL